jgi:hypothetical protein
VDKHCPLPTPDDRLFFILVYLKSSALQVVHGRLFGMARAKPTCGCTCSCPCCSRPCAPLAMRPPVLRAPWPSASGSRGGRRHRGRAAGGGSSACGHFRVRFTPWEPMVESG